MATVAQIIGGGVFASFQCFLTNQDPTAPYQPGELQPLPPGVTGPSVPTITSMTYNKTYNVGFMEGTVDFFITDSFIWSSTTALILQATVDGETNIVAIFSFAPGVDDTRLTGEVSFDISCSAFQS